MTRKFIYILNRKDTLGGSLLRVLKLTEHRTCMSLLNFSGAYVDQSYHKDYFIVMTVAASCS